LAGLLVTAAGAAPALRDRRPPVSPPQKKTRCYRSKADYFHTTALPSLLPRSACQQLQAGLQVHSGRADVADELHSIRRLCAVRQLLPRVGAGGDRGAGGRVMYVHADQRPSRPPGHAVHAVPHSARCRAPAAWAPHSAESLQHSLLHRNVCCMTTSSDNQQRTHLTYWTRHVPAMPHWT